MADLKRPIPKRMLHLDRDHRGYPIPVMVWRDPTGRPHFTINDEAKRVLAMMDETCSICGQPLQPIRWLTGGPLSAFHEHGAYSDPPMHAECLRYAMKVCPYLAAPVYSKRVDARTITTPIEPNRIFADQTMIPDRPALFVCVASRGQRIKFTGTGLLSPIYVIPSRPYVKIEFWQHGKQISHEAANKIIKPMLAAA